MRMTDDAASVPFPTTCWSQLTAALRERGPVAGARGEDAAERAAFDTLAQRYWRPIEAYLRQALRRGTESQDLTQDFFLWMMETGFLNKADPTRGRFRAFVKVALRNYVTDRDRHRLAQKRAGDAASAARAADASELDVVDPQSKPPDQRLDDLWRAELVQHALTQVEHELQDHGRAIVFAVFRDYFLDAAQDLDYNALAERHRLTRVQVSNHLMQAKRIYRAKLRTLVADTVRGPRELEEELLWLFGKDAR